MNPHTYAQIYSSFHGSETYQVFDNVISLPIASVSFEPIFLLRFHKFDSVSQSVPHPLAGALAVHFNTESTCSAFEHGDTWSLLVGNKLMVYPHAEQTVYSFATPYFVSDVAVMDRYLRNDEARSMQPFVYAYKNALVYLDRYDVPCPGERYWTSKPDPKFHRVCILTNNAVDALALAKEIENVPNVKTFLFKTRRRNLELPCVPTEPVRAVAFPDESLSYTATVDKRLTRPDFLIQDILESYAKKSGAKLENVGLVLQYPFNVGYEGCSEEGCGSGGRYVALAVNGHTPSRVLYSRAPYDKYLEYTHVPALPWTRLGYRVPTDLPSGVSKVVIDSVTVGLEYRGAFLCLEHPILESTPVHPNLLNTDCMLTLPTQNALRNRNVQVLETYRYDADRVLLRISLKGFEHGLWCLADRPETDTYPKRKHPPTLVQEWLSFYALNRDKKTDGDSLTAVKLALVLARHKICFRTRICDKAREAEISNREIVLHMESKAVEYVNSVRLDEYREQRQEEDDGGCTIM